MTAAVSALNRLGTAAPSRMIVVNSHVRAGRCLPSERSVNADALLERDPDRARPLVRRSEFHKISMAWLAA
jgi:hypothetical protein